MWTYFPTYLAQMHALYLEIGPCFVSISIYLFIYLFVAVAFDNNKGGTKWYVCADMTFRIYSFSRSFLPLRLCMALSMCNITLQYMYWITV